MCYTVAILENARHEKFAQELAKGVLSQRKAYRVAFPRSVNWKDETVDSKASALAKSDKVLARIKELQEEAASKAVMTATQRKEWLTNLIQNDGETTQNKLKAVDLLNKMDGEYIEKVQLGGNVNNPFEGLTTDELKKLVNGE